MRLIDDDDVKGFDPHRRIVCCGHSRAHLVGDLDRGIALLDKALVLNPNLAAAWFLRGFLRAWRGESDNAIEHFARAMRLSPSIRSSIECRPEWL